MINEKPTYEELVFQNNYLKNELAKLQKQDISEFDSSNEIEFKDLFNLKEIQQIQDLFAEATGVASIIKYPSGIPITNPSNFCRLCNDIIRKTEKGLKNCYHSDSEIGKQNKVSAIYQPCLSGGLWDGGASITVGGKHIANWLIGQVKNESIDEKKILLYAKEIGADENEFKIALNEVTEMSTEKFKKIADILFFFANEISNKAYQNIRQQKLIKDLKKKEDQLIKSKEKAEIREGIFRKMNENSPLGMHFYNLENNKLIFVNANPAASSILKIDNSIFIGKTIEEAFPSLVQTEVPYHYRLAAEKGISWTTEQINYNENNIIGAFEVRAFQTTPGNMVAIFFDITDRKKAELLLQEKNKEIEAQNEEYQQINQELLKAKQKIEISEEKFRLMIKNSNDTYVLINKGGEQFYISDAAIRDTGYTIDELKGPIQNVIFPEDLNKVLQTWNEILSKKEEIIRVQYRHKHKYKDYIWYEAVAQNFLDNPSIGAVVVNVRDITSIKETENELRNAKEVAQESEEKYKSMVSILPDGVIIHQNGKIVYANATAGQIMKAQKPEDVLNMEAINFVHPDYREIALERIKQSILHKIPAHTIEEVFIGFDQKPIYVYVTAMPFQFEGKQSMLTVFTDLTSRKLIEDELRNAKNKAEESDQLKTAFLQNMSHEIRTPMNAIIGFSSFLDRPDLTAEKRKSFVSIIQNSTNQLLSIITDILSISAIETKQEKAAIDKVCVNNVIVDLLAIFKNQSYNQNISLYAKQQLTDKQSEILTDKTKITQILTNLITNALKFTHDGFIEFGYNLKDDFLEFYVKDSGIGIMNEMQDKIFERFRQANENISKKYGGTGLGLAISKAFTEILGGKIWVESEIDRGSTFYFTIPYKQTESNYKINSLTPISLNKTTILIAEDEHYNFLYLEELLNNLDIELIHTKNGKETVEICKINQNINIILMDIKMPIMDGFTAAKLIKEFRPDLPIIAQSAYALDQERAKFSGSEFDDYITKPINKEKLITVINKFINNLIN